MSAPVEAQEQVFSSDQEDLQCVQLRQKISIKQVQMLHIINNKDKFISTITEHCNIAKNKIQLNEKQQLKFALVHLKESEKILEYGANSGKNINKELIITVLHNQASIYQKLWELNNCSDYLEGIIFNYENFIRQTSNQGSTLSKDIHGMPADPTKCKMKQKLARYNLQFCAVSSQLATHDIAIQAVEKAHYLMLQCIKGCGQEFKRQWGKQGMGEGEIHIRMDLLMGLAAFNKRIQSHLETGELSKNIMKATHFSLQMWNQRKQKGIETSNPADLQYLDHLNSYSIGNIVQIVAIKLDKSQIGFMSMREKGSLQFDRQFHPYNRIILLSTCFFSKATELRLKASQLFRKNVEEKKSSRQFKLSISYHLIAIAVVATFIPTNLKYLSQILMSYQKHYGVNLNEYKTVEVESLHKMMEILGIQISELLTSTKHNTQRAELQLDSKNDYNMKTAFEHNRVKKLDKMKSLKKITKQLTDPLKKYDHKELKTPKDKSKDSKTSFSISKYEKKDRTTSRTDNRSRDFKHSRDSRDKNLDSHKNIPKIKVKRPHEMHKSRQKDDKKSKHKQFVDQTEQLFFCFTKKTKKTGVNNPNSQLRSSSIASNSCRKSNKKSILSPKNIKINKVTSPSNVKHQKSPHRKNFGDHNNYF